VPLNTPESPVPNPDPPNFLPVGYASNGIGKHGHSFGRFEGETVERGTGTVSFYDPQRNFGFIEPDDGGADVIFYLRAGDEQVDIGDRVIFDLSPRASVTEMGRQAIRVTRTGFPAGQAATQPVS
jgi:CspA family cold shock protein